MSPQSVPRQIGNYWLEECLGSGYSGSIFKAVHIHSGTRVALKIQDVNHECPTNRYERHIYPHLQGGEGMPTLWASGVEGKWDYLVIDLLGTSLERLHKGSGKPCMDLRSVCAIAVQLISLLETMHNRGVLHRDIQLGNCVIGLPPKHTRIYMIDFGFSKQYIDPRTHRHIPDSKEKRDFLGNYWFTSVNVHCRGKVPSRRDDLEAAALMLIHLLTPYGLPWTRNGVPKTDYAHNKIKRAKKNAAPEDLCQGIPQEFEDFLRYCRRLRFADCPDYKQWIDAFKDLGRSKGFGSVNEFIWPPPPVPTPVISAQAAVRKSRSPGVTDAQIEEALNGLANLQLTNRPILGEKTNFPDPGRQGSGKSDAQLQKAKELIELSSDEDDTSNLARPTRISKAMELVRLTKSVDKAPNNQALADVVRQFTKYLQSTRSRTLTKEGFAFLDALHKQLADPSIHTMPLRTSRNDSQDAQAAGAYAKLNAIASLKREVAKAGDNRTLAKMIADFGTITNRSTSRTITKDGFAFLDGVAEQLQALA